MKRNLILLTLLVLVAAAINLAIALCLWWYSTKNDLDFGNAVEISPRDVADWRDLRQPGWPLDPELAYMSKYYGITCRELVWKDEEWLGSPGDGDFKVTKLDTNMIIIVEFGWPLRCISEERWLEVREPEGSYDGSRGEFEAFDAVTPNRVIWAGMFINILYYCFMIALAILCWIYGLRTFRQSRGRCIKCGYNLRANSERGCPECGWERKDKDNEIESAKPSAQ